MNFETECCSRSRQLTCAEEDELTVARKAFSGSKLWAGTSCRTLENARRKNINPSNKRKSRWQKEGKQHSGWLSSSPLCKQFSLFKYVNPSLAAEKTITETSMTVIVVYSYLNRDFSHCILGGSCRAYLPELAEWPNKSCTWCEGSQPRTIV